MAIEDKNLEQQMEAYKQLAQQNKDVDVASLMINALQQHEDNKLTTKEKTRAYLVSVVLPPFGLIYVAKFLLSDKEDAKRAALVCVGLTVFSIAMFWLLMKIMFSSSGTSLDQIQQITPQQIYQTFQ